MPVSKKRKKKNVKPYGPPLSKEALAAKSTSKVSRQKIAIYIVSAIIIVSMTIGIVVSAFAPAAPHGGGIQPQQSGILEPAPANQQDTTDTQEENASESTTEEQDTTDTQAEDTSDSAAEESDSSSE